MCNPTSKALCSSNNCNLCYNRSFASHPMAQFWSLKNEITPRQVFIKSNKKYLFNCNTCRHELLLCLNSIKKDKMTCAYCNKSGICLNNSCTFCFNKSFASHPMASSWSENNPITPREVCKGSENEYEFKCKDCNHYFSSKLYSIKNNKHCPYCSNQILCSNLECTICLEKSCESHEMKNAWSADNDIIPRMVFKQSNNKRIFNCLKCNHTYISAVNKYYRNNGCCPYCANQKLCEDNNCETCYNKSFASHPRVLQLSPNNNIIPRKVFKGSEIRCKFICDKCNTEFESFLYNILSGYWCPYCKKKTEAKLLEFLKTEYSNCKTQVRFDWCRFSETNNIMPCDFGITDYKIIIELDGSQHFIQVSNWNNPNDIREKDIEKIRYCIENGYTIIRIKQEDIWLDKYDWKQLLKNQIELHKESEPPQCIFIETGNIYDKHRELLTENIEYININPKDFIELQNI